MKIMLSFNKTLTRLAGNSFGREVYDIQVKDNINFKEMNIIEFPKEIEDIAISFVQGFTQGIFENINKDEFSKFFTIKGNQKVIDKFNRSVYF